MTQEDIDNFKLADEVNEILETIEVGKFGTGEKPLRELATIGYMLKHGLTITEIYQLYSANLFPSLKIPESQSALVQLVERQGHESLITEMLTEETIEDETELAATVGFRAFMRMVQVTDIAIEDAITHFKHEDFISQEWKSNEHREKIIETREERIETFTEYVESEEIHETGNM